MVFQVIGQENFWNLKLLCTQERMQRESSHESDSQECKKSLSSVLLAQGSRIIPKRIFTEAIYKGQMMVLRTQLCPAGPLHDA